MSERKTLEQFKNKSAQSFEGVFFESWDKLLEYFAGSDSYILDEIIDNLIQDKLEMKEFELKAADYDYQSQMKAKDAEIESLKQQITSNEKELDENHQMIFELQHDLKEATQQLIEREWISVDERLPDKEARVLCIGISGNVCIDYWSDASYSMGLFQTAGNFKMSHTHWQPLQKPPTK